MGALPDYDFGVYRLELSRRRLLRGGEPISLTPKAFDVLVALIERRDRVVDKQELMKVVWPDSFVEEANLSQTIFVLRKTLGDDANGRPFIDTVPRRGYRFAADVRTVSSALPRPRAIVWGAVAVAAAITVSLAGATWTAIRARRAAADPMAGKMRLVVLPFENLTHDRNDDWLAGAFSDSLTIGLQDLDTVICVSRDRIVELYRQQSMTESAPLDAQGLQRLSGTLGVGYYVHGSYQRSGDRIRVIARLVDTGTGDVRTQESVTDELSNLLKLEDDLEAGQRAAAFRQETSSLEAYREVIESENAYSAANFQDVHRHLERAVQLDPRYARAWALRSKTSSRLAAAATFVGGSLAELHESALASAQRAVALAPSLYDAHTALALAYRETGRVDLWRLEAEKAIALNPRLAEAYELLADWYFATPGYGCSHGHDPALAEKYFRTALAIDRRYATAWANLIYHLHYNLQLDEAMRVADEAVKTFPEGVGVRRARATALVFVKRYDEAERVIGGIPEAERSVQDRWVLGTIALTRGEELQASHLFDDVIRRMPGTVWQLSAARSYFIVNEVEKGLTYVDQAVKQDPACAEYAATAPAFAPYRDTPAFRARLAAWKSIQ
jgi:DNA-binding winged helix-turn-helix (wHTH) protein/TolB-like protein